MNLQTVFVVVKKELLQESRERAAILFGIVLPPLLMSLIGGLVYAQVSRHAQKQASFVLRIGATDDDMSAYAELGWNWFRRSTFWSTDPKDLQNLAERLQSGVAPGAAGPPVALKTREEFVQWCRRVASNQRMIASQFLHKSFQPSPRERELFQVVVLGLGGIEWIKFDKIANTYDAIAPARVALENRSIDLYILANDVPKQSPEGSNRKSSEWTLLHDTSKPESARAKFCVNEYLSACNSSSAGPAVVDDEIDVSPNLPFTAGISPLLESMATYISFSLLILVINCVFAFAIDIVARERSELTLEPLLITQADRLSIVLGKYIATAALSLLSAAFTIASMWLIMLSMISDAIVPYISFTGNLKVMLLLDLLCIPLVLAATGIAIVISIIAESAKVANALNGIAKWAIIALGISLFPGGISPGLLVASVPILGSLLMMKQLVIGGFNWSFFVTSMISSSIVAVAGLILTARFANRESILYES